MRIGNLRHRVEVEELTRTLDDMGQEITEWKTVATVWAAVEPVSGKEYWAAAYVQAERTVKVTIRYRPGITAGHRLTFRGETYDIQAVLNVEGRDRALQLMCRVKEGK